ncbi:MAG: rod shape-determining protein RodA [Gammaproteobacteria bacterium RBG_16_57_12]|nr:MAG: rod shape-determining protein RodA [Gammaproteobacteria bacterium RBG_16_57_12]
MSLLETVSQKQKSGWVAMRLHVDVPLMAGILVLFALGMMILFSASGQSIGRLEAQGMRFVLGLVILLVLAQISPEHLRRWSPWLFAIGVCLLLAVEIIGDIGKGAQRWLDLGIIRFQPSEMMKLVVPMTIAWFLCDKPLPPAWRNLLISSAMILVPALLIAKQPDLGTALLIASSGIFVLLLSGLSARLIIGLTALASALAPLLWYTLRDYQRQRVLTFLNPENDPLGAGYHIIQSKIAIGSGGVFGKGWFNGTQSQLDFLPERSTDFILAVFAEEFGFIGVLILLAVYLFIIMRGLLIAVQAQDSFSRLLAGSLTLTFFIYVFVNIGMVSGLLPVVGVPLPLVSYGGTSLVTLMAGFGILMSVHSHRKLLKR